MCLDWVTDGSLPKPTDGETVSVTVLLELRIYTPRGWKKIFDVGMYYYKLQSWRTYNQFIPTKNVVRWTYIEQR